MADSEDMKLLESGEMDLSRCDFRDAKLDGMDLRGRNFSHCLLERASCVGTRFDGSDFTGAKVSFINANNAIFDGCKLAYLHFGYADLSEASFKNGIANGARFQHAKLDGANMEGTQLRSGAIDADTTLSNIISNENTDFEGLQVLRPTARDSLFKDYTFTKGTLHRQIINARSADVAALHRMPSSILENDDGSPVGKRNQVPPPAFQAMNGEAIFNYANHDGRALIGVGQTVFETKWSNAGRSSIHVYNDPSGIRGVAIAPDAKSPSDVTTASIAGLDFSSRTRMLHEGQVVVFENSSGRYLAAKVVEVLATSHGSLEDRLVLHYAVVPTDDKAIQLAEIAILAKTAEDKLRSLSSDFASIDSRHGGIGHNNPPEPTPLSTEEFDETVDALQIIRRETFQSTPNKTKLSQVKKIIAIASQKIVAWVGKKCDLAAEEFAKQIGKTLGDKKFIVAAWLEMSGKLDQLLAALSAYLPL